MGKKVGKYGITDGSGTVGMALDCIVTLVVSRLTPPPPEAIRHWWMWEKSNWIDLAGNRAEGEEN